MDLELLDRLEDRVDVAVQAVNELRMENEMLKEEASDLRKKIAALTSDLEESSQAKSLAVELRGKCEALGEKLGSVRGRVESMVEKMKALEA
jgi:FtsZ-binding cell division protein ZapB